ncbi:unnamed protein product, partial [Ectocarpus sp. 6 AP-2014]
ALRWRGERVAVPRGDYSHPPSPPCGFLRASLYVKHAFRRGCKAAYLARPENAPAAETTDLPPTSGCRAWLRYACLQACNVVCPKLFFCQFFVVQIIVGMTT